LNTLIRRPDYSPAAPRARIGAVDLSIGIAMVLGIVAGILGVWIRDVRHR
jgi:hypothetical protein